MAVAAFWLLAASLTVGAVTLLAAALLRRDKRYSAAGDLNLGVYRQRLAELDAERAAGALAPEAFEQARGELEQALLDDLAIAEPPRSHTGRAAWPTLVLLALALPALAFGLYFQLGAPALATLAPATTPARADTAQAHAVSDMVARLAARLQREPDDGQGWAMLGRSYLALRQPGLAVQAFAKAHALLGEQAALLANYAEALALAGGDSLAGKPSQLVARALALEPDNPKALWLDGIAARQRGDQAAAVRSWQRLVRQLPPGGREAEAVRQYITAAGGEPAAVAAGTGVEVTISLAPELADRLVPGAVVFVYARATQGPRAPLAVVRRPVDALPLTIRLDDSQAMSPELKLSAFAEVVVGARISQSGAAAPRSGDLQGQSTPLRPSPDAKAAVVIDQAVP